MAKAQTPGVNFGELSMYSAGGGLPEGNYVLFFTVAMHQAVRANGTTAGPEKLAVIVDAHDLNALDEQPRKQIYGMGSKAHLSFAPNPETGKGVVAIPGGPATSLNDSTNWAVFLKSLYDCGLPQGILTNDFTTIDGIHVHIQNQPEPESRKSMRSNMSEATDDGPKGNGMIAVVSEILESGKPWEGTGGIPEAAPAKPKAGAKAAPKAAPAAAKAPLKAVAKAAPVVSEDEAVESATLAAITSILEEKPDGVSKLMLRTGTFKHVKENVDDDTAQAAASTYFSSDDALNTILAGLGYKVSGTSVVVA